MSAIKKLAGQTVIYGLSSIVGRFLNYLLVPLHTSVAFGFSTDQYGIITEMYAYVAFLIVLLTYGMETSFFRFYNKYPEKKDQVYSTAMLALLTTTTLAILGAFMFAQPISNSIGYPDHSEFIIWFAIIVGFDAVSSIPLAKLRVENQPMKFAKINLANIAVNIGLNLFFLLILPLFGVEVGVGYVFIANLAASVVKFLLLSPDFFKNGKVFNKTLFREMLKYGLPILFFGLAGIVNETIDRIMLKNLLVDKFLDAGHSIKVATSMAQSENGIYGAVYKISIIITLFVQAFRYAAEPFFFSQEKKTNAKKTYAKVMNYFVLVVSIIFLMVTLYIDIFKHFVPNQDYWVGLKVVPILLFANICLGIYFSQSIWYKLTDRTIWGAYLAVFGAIITLTLNYIWIPKYGYEGSAWATLITYVAMMIASYILGQKYYPIKYNLRKIFFYLGLSISLYFLGTTIEFNSSFVNFLLKTLVFSFYLFIVWGLEKPNLKLKR